MFGRLMVCALVVSTMAAGSDPRASGQDDVRSGFLISRGKKATPKRVRPKRPPVAGALGIGYTVFRRAPSGLPSAFAFSASNSPSLMTP